MTVKCACFSLVALVIALIAPRAARADEASDKVDLVALQQQGNALAREADHLTPGAPGADAAFLKSALHFQSVHQRFCGGSGPEGRFIPDHTVCEELAFNAARAFAFGHDPVKAIPMYRKVVTSDERARGHSAIAARSAYALGSTYQALSIYELAAEWYERYAIANPQADDAPASLSDAVILRLGLAQDEQAVRNASLYVKTYGASRPQLAAQIMLALGMHHAEKEEWEQARSVLASSMALIDRAAAIDGQVQAHAAYARVLAHGRTPSAAKDEYAKTRALWKDPRAAEEALRAAWPAEDDARKDRRLAKSLNAVGEATFAAAEDRRIAEIEPLKFPLYVGAADVAAVTSHVENKVRPWFLKKKLAIEGVEAALIQILDLRPFPAPKWVIAAGATVGTMWGSFADDMRRLPVPDAWRKTPAVHRAYVAAVEDMSESIRARHAKPAMKKCIDLSVKYQFQDARTHACEQWLALNYKAELHLVEEVVPALRVSGAPADPAPFTYEGQPLHH